MCLDCQNHRICAHYDRFVKAQEDFGIVFKGVEFSEHEQFKQEFFNFIKNWCGLHLPKVVKHMKKEEMEKLRQQLEEDGYTTLVQHPIHHPHQNQFKIIVTGRKDE